MTIELVSLVSFLTFNVEICCDLEIGDTGHSTSYKMIPFLSATMTSCRRCMLNMGLSITFSESKSDWGRKSPIFLNPLYFASLVMGRGCPCIWILSPGFEITVTMALQGG